MIYNAYNEVVCDFNCNFCEIIDDCPDRIEEPEEIEKNKIVEFNNSKNIILM